MNADRGRLLLTALLVYALFVNPALTNPMTWSALDAAGALVETGRWHVMHADLYGDMDIALSGTRKVAGPPPGLAILLVPVYAVWRAVAGVVDTTARFEAFHVFARLGASRRGRLWAALLFAFGTPAFLFAVRLFKENVAALVVIVAFRLAMTVVTPRGRGLAGLLAGLAAIVAYPAGLIAIGLAAVIAARDGRRGLADFVLGWLPPLVGLALYNAWFFGRPWRFAYSSYINLPEAAPSVGFTLPDFTVLLNSLVHQREGLLLYSPFLILAVGGLVGAWRAGRRIAVATVVVFTVLLWAVSAAWLARFPSSFTGARYLFAAVPLLAAFAAPALERSSAAVRWPRGGGAGALTSLTVPAGPIADPAPLVYSLKTFVSGFGVPVLFKETLPAAVGLETLHTMLARPDVTGRDLLALLATPAGWRLALDQMLVVAVTGAVVALVAVLIRRLWARPRMTIADAPPALAG